MKNRLGFSLSVILLLIASREGFSQNLGFNPSSASYVDSLGADSVLSFTTVFTTLLDRGQQPYSVTFGHNPGIVTDPGVIYVDNYGETSTTVKIKVYLDSVWDTSTLCAVGMPGLWANAGLPVWFGINLWIYNPSIRGKVHLSADSVDFGPVTLGTIKSQYIGISIDTPGSIFRKLGIRHMTAPFAWEDSVTPYHVGSCPFGSGESSAFFEPTEVGKYIDSVYIYDPIQKDSTLLILLGEGVAAGVSETPVAAELRVYPNPADGATNVSLANNAIESVTLYNILGNPVMEVPADGEGYLTLNTASVPSGIYYLEAASKEKVYREQVIVSH